MLSRSLFLTDEGDRFVLHRGGCRGLVSGSVTRLRALTIRFAPKTTITSRAD
jgi:hypothetical protein